jgi:ferritin-like metal-binding protein YciE
MENQTNFGNSEDENAEIKANAQRAVVNDSKLKELFVEELKDIFWAENHLVQALPKMKEAATSTELKNAFEEHLQTTRNQVERLKEVFKMLGEQAQGKECEAMKGLTKEAEGIIEDTEAGTATRDVALIIAAQKVEHYEIATYGALAQLGRTLGLLEVATLLDITLEEEKETDHLLTTIAEDHVNYQAKEETE